MLAGQAQIEYMILGAIEEIAPDIVSTYWSRVNLTDGGRWDSCNGALLQELMDARGPGTILQLSEHFPQKALSSPIIYILLNSADPKAMMKKMIKYDRHFIPSTCRLVMCESGLNDVVAKTIPTTDSQPLIATELFLCGAIKTMLKLLGCGGVKIMWESVRSEQLQKVLASLDIKSAEVGKNTRWRFCWESYRRREQIIGLDEFLVCNAEPFIISNKISVTHRVEEILTKDLTSRPSMQEVAEELGMSVRTFQRKLNEEGVTYSRIYNNLRIKTASRMLRQTNTSLTEIGFICGFSDSAHFSREFKKVQNMTPIMYRETHHFKKV